jgi:uncharacterized membrane protein YdjX (TVP38/TMEM64 family)
MSNPDSCQEAPRASAGPAVRRASSVPPPAKAVALQLVAFGVAALVLFVVSRLIPLDQLLHKIDGFIAAHRPWSTLCYPLVHATCNLLLLPAGILVVGSGFLFGLWRGFLLALTGHLLGATGAFWISRTFGRRFIERHLASRPQWRELDAAIAREGWKIVLLSQMSPLFPTSLFNYCYGLTRLRFWPCLGWIALGWAPGMFVYAYLGGLGHASYRTYRAGGHFTLAQYGPSVAGLLASLVVTVTLARLALRLLRDARERARSTGSTPVPAAAGGRPEAGEIQPAHEPR